MTAVKDIITVFCKCLHDSIDSSLTPEHFRLAKYDKGNSEVIEDFWTTIDKLSYFTLKESNPEIHLTNFDKYIRTKLRMAYLNYPNLEFYNLSETTNDSGSRILLIALVWLITKFNVLSYVIRMKTINSPLGREFSEVDVEDKIPSHDQNLLTIEKQIDNILHKSHKLSCNLKAVSELLIEKVNLTTRVHAASLNISGLPHLTVAQMALVKKLKTNKTADEKDLNKLRDFEKTASMLDAHMKWKKKKHIFYTWMNTVIDEEMAMDSDKSMTELSKFIFILKSVIKMRIKSFKNNNDLNVLSTSCPAQLLRTQEGPTESESVNKNIVSNGENLRKKRFELQTELDKIYELLPNCFQINS